MGAAALRPSLEWVFVFTFRPVRLSPLLLSVGSDSSNSPRLFGPSFGFLGALLDRLSVPRGFSEFLFFPPSFSRPSPPSARPLLACGKKPLVFFFFLSFFSLWSRHGRR